MTGWKRVLAATAVFASAVAVRALPGPLVLEPERVVLFGFDAYYHLRRILYSLAEFPAVLQFDPYIHFPDGAKPIWSPVFDWGVAALALPFAGGDDPEAVLRFAVWLPPLLGGGAVLALMRLARRHFDSGEAWVCGALLAVAPGHFWYSQLGFLDHHAAVALQATLCVGAAMSLASAIDAGRRAWPAAGAFGVLAATSLLVWPGALLHVGLLEAGLVVFALTRPERAHAIAGARALAGAHAVALAITLPLTWNSAWPQWGAFSPVVLTHFQPWLFAALAAHAGSCAAAWRGEAAGSTPARRRASGVAIGAALLVASAGLLPGIVAGAEDAWRWLSRGEAFQGTVAESLPLFVDGRGRFSVDIAAARLTGFVFLAPIALAWLWLGSRPGRDAAAFRIFLFWSAGLLAATVAQRRFFNSSAVAMAAITGLTLCRAWRQLPLPWRTGRLRTALGAAFAIGVAAILAPALPTYRYFIDNRIAAAQGKKLVLTLADIDKRIALETAEWMRDNTPPTRGWLDAQASPEYGVLAPWPLGHIVATVAQRPAIVTNFGDDLGPENFRLMERYYRAGEGEAAVLLERLGVRYVIAQENHQFLGPRRPGRGSMFHSLWFLDGSRGAQQDARGDRVRALARHRLVHESRPERPPGNGGRPRLKVFEVVAGAQVSGRGRPGATVRVALPLQTNLMRRAHYETETVVGPTGAYHLRLPYASRGGPPGVRATGPYELSCDGVQATLAVDEAAVQAGRDVSGPTLCAVW